MLAAITLQDAQRRRSLSPRKKKASPNAAAADGTVPRDVLQMLQGLSLEDEAEAQARDFLALVDGGDASGTPDSSRRTEKVDIGERAYPFGTLFGVCRARKRPQGRCQAPSLTL